MTDLSLAIEQTEQLEVTWHMPTVKRRPKYITITLELLALAALADPQILTVHRGQIRFSLADGPLTYRVLGCTAGGLVCEKEE